MMFLEFAIWGAWFVVLGNYLNALGFSRKHIGRIYSTMPIGAIIAPMFMGTIADRYLNAEHVMAISHLLGAVLLVCLSRIRTPRAFFWVALAYAILYSPTLSLVNAVVFDNVPATANFPELRVLGTIGWIVAGMSLKLFIRSDEPVNNRPILLAAALSFILGGFSFALPETPPGAAVAQQRYDARIMALDQQLEEGAISQATYDAEKQTAEEALRQSGEIPFIRALKMFRDPQATIFFAGALIIAMAMAIYFAFAALYLEQRANVRPDNVGPVMTIGQWVEIFFLYTLSWFIDNWGMKVVLLVGMGAWATRFAIFAVRRPQPLIPLLVGIDLAVIAVGLHGICFDFFFAAGMMHTENIAPEGITASAQSLYGVLVYGLGMWLGSEFAGWLNHTFTRESVDPATRTTTRVTDWTKFWAIPCVGVLVAFVAFLLFWKPKQEPEETTTPTVSQGQEPGTK